jgi:hypothetical protein
MPYQVGLPVAVLLLALSPVPLAGAVLGSWLLVRQTPARYMVILAWATAVFQFAYILRGGAVANARYMLTQMALWCVLSGPGLLVLQEQLLARRAKLVLAGALACLLITPAGILMASEKEWSYSEKFASVSPRLRFPRYLVATAQALRPLLQSGDAVVLDQYRGESNLLRYALGLPLDSDDRVFSAYEQVLRDLPGFIRMRRPRFMVYSPNGNIQRVLRIPPRGGAAVDDALGANFVAVTSNSVYAVYRITYAGE